MRLFLRKEYPSKIFMPAIGVKTSTIHKWAARGYIYLGEPGTGKAVVLTGRQILYAACLSLISRSGALPNASLRGLRDCVDIYAENWQSSLPHVPPTLRYCVYKFVDEGFMLNAEWQLEHKPERKEGTHIVEATGSLAEPLWWVIDLHTLLKRLTIKIEGKVEFDV